MGSRSDDLLFVCWGVMPEVVSAEYGGVRDIRRTNSPLYMIEQTFSKCDISTDVGVLLRKISPHCVGRAAYLRMRYRADHYDTLCTYVAVFGIFLVGWLIVWGKSSCVLHRMDFDSWNC